MLSVDKYTNVLYDKKEAVVMMPLSEKKLLTTGKFTTTDYVKKRTEKVKTSEEVLKGTDEVHKLIENITKMRRLTEVLKNFKV